eukprot:13857932-Alexandrium_andersonii.AAC.1
MLTHSPSRTGTGAESWRRQQRGLFQCGSGAGRPASHREVTDLFVSSTRRPKHELVFGCNLLAPGWMPPP